MSKKIDMPPRWAICTIEEVVAFDGVFTDGDWVESKDQDPNGDVRLIQLADIGDGKFQNKSARFLTKGKAYDLNCTFLSKGDLLVARMPDPLGRCCMFPLSGEEAHVTVVDVCAIRFGSSHINHEYMMYLINNPEIRSAISALQSGSTRKRISRKNLATIELPIAPVAEQHRIVAKIEELFSELDKGIESLKTAREQLKVYRQAVLKHAFDGKLTTRWREENKGKLETANQLLARIQKEREARYQLQLEEWEASEIAWNKNGRLGKKPVKSRKFSAPNDIAPSELNNLSDLPAGWRWCKTGHIFDVYVGSTPSRKNLGYWGGEIPWVSSGEVAFCRINDTDEKITKQGYANASTQIHPVGTVMLAMIGEGKTRGQPAILNIEAAHNQNTAAIRVSETDCNAPLFYYYLQYQYELTRNLGSGNNQKALNKDRVSNMIVPLAPVKEQTEMAAHIEENLSLVENIDSGILEDLGRIEVLRQSILKKAFSGQLVAQDPNDEPASILLERIKVEKVKQAPKKKAPRRKAVTNSTRRKKVSA